MSVEDAQRSLNKFKGAVGRLFGKFGSEMKLLPGTCFLIAPDLAVTCHHVIHLGADPIRDLVLVFEGAPDVKIPAAEYKTLGIGPDLTILRLERSVPHTPLPCGFDEPWGEQFATYGYPTAHDGTGISVTGQISGPTTIVRNADVFSRVEITTAARRIGPGFSGAPVFVASTISAGYVVGCISETPSEAYPDVPSYTPLVAFRSERLEPLFADLVAPDDLAREHLSDSISQSDDAASWRVAKHLVNPNYLHSTVDDPLSLSRIAQETFAAVSRAKSSAHADDDVMIRQLQVVVTGLRVKYQQMPFDLDALEKQASVLEHSPSVDEKTLVDIVKQAEIVSTDFKAIPLPLLNFAKSHGASIHGRVLDGWCARTVEHLALLGRRKKPGRPGFVLSPSAYDFENIARLFNSMTALLKLDIASLSHGYLDSGWVKTIEGRPQLFMAVAVEGDYPLVAVYCENEGEMSQAAQLVARKVRFERADVLIDRQGVPLVIAAANEYLYKWRLSAPTPFFQLRAGEEHFYGMRHYYVLDRYGDDILVETYSAKFLRLQGDRVVAQWSGLDRDTKADAWIEDDVINLAHTDGAMSESLVLMSQFEPRRSMSMPELLLTQYGDLVRKALPHPDAWDLVSVGNIFSVRHTYYRGAPCLTALVGFNPLPLLAVVFLDPTSLRSLRTPVLTDQSVLDLAVAEFSGKSHLVATLLATRGNKHAIAAWDISDPVGKDAPPLLGKWHEVGTDAVSLQIAPGSSGWTAYYNTSTFDGSNVGHEIWRFEWPSRKHRPLVKAGAGNLRSLSVVCRP